MINSQEIKIGTCIRLDGKIWTCIDFQHRKPGKGNTVMITKLKNVSDGRVLERTFQVGFKLEDVRVERRPYQYLYQDATGYIFMNQETFEQIPIPKHQITGSDYMKEGDVVEVVKDTSACRNACQDDTDHHAQRAGYQRQHRHQRYQACNT